MTVAIVLLVVGALFLLGSGGSTRSGEYRPEPTGRRSPT